MEIEVIIVERETKPNPDWDWFIDEIAKLMEEFNNAEKMGINI